MFVNAFQIWDGEMNWITEGKKTKIQKSFFSKTWEVPREIEKLCNQFSLDLRSLSFISNKFFELQTSSPWQPASKAELHMISA